MTGRHGSGHAVARRGQGMTEYVIVLGIVALGLIGALRAFGGVVNRTYGKATAAVESLGTQMGEDASDDDGNLMSKEPRRTMPPICAHPTIVDGVCLDCGARP